jgi:hypothetical protein
MAVDVKIIVTDAPPLITLAAAKSLDYLLYPVLPVIIPDAVFFEATNAAGKLGAQEILDWYRQHTDAVRAEPTEVFASAQLVARRAGRGARDLGERAALEVIRTYPLAEQERALLLSDDRDVGRVVAIDPDRLILLTTWDYLRQLEEAQRIQSADAGGAVVREAGRNAPTRDMWRRQDPEIRHAVRAAIEGAQRARPPGNDKR